MEDFVLGHSPPDYFVDVIDIIDDSTTSDAVSKKIRSFGNLPEGWDFGVGTFASLRTIRGALEIQLYGPAFGLKTNAFPGTDGEISITFYCKDESVDITINPDQTYTVTHEKGIGVDYERLAYEEDVDLSVVLNFLNRLRCAAWKSSEDFILVSTTPILKDSGVTPSRTPTEQSPLLTWIAYEIIQPMYVAI